MERTGIVTGGGKPLTLVGPELKVGDPAPPFTVIDKDSRSVTLADFAGKALLISVTPSLDTKICHLQVEHFNEEAAKLPGTAAVLNVSMDLPFALARFAEAFGLDRVIPLSDHREASFGLGWGVLIKELRLLARTVFVVDAKGIIRYIQRVPEMGVEPDYDQALAALRGVLR